MGSLLTFLGSYSKNKSDKLPPLKIQKQTREEIWCTSSDDDSPISTTSAPSSTSSLSDAIYTFEEMRRSITL